MRIYSFLVPLMALFAPVVAVPVGSAHAAAGASPCDEPAEIRAELARLEGGELAKLPPQERATQIHDAYIALLAEHPMDVHVHRSYQDFVKYELVEKLTEAGARYEQLLAQSPGSPLALYLAGRMRIEEEPEVAREYLEQAAAADPSWPWPHLGLAFIYSRNGPFSDLEKLDREVSTLLSLCPTSDASFAYLGEVRDPDVKRRATIVLRSFLGHSVTPQKLAMFPELWSQEFRLSSLADHSKIRASVAADLSRLRKLDWKTNEDWWQALYEGYKLVPDQAGLDWIAQQILKHAPQSWIARQIHIVDWQERNEPPPGTGKEAETRYLRKLLMESEKWMKIWPDDVMACINRFQAMKDLPDVPADQIAQTADSLLAAEAKSGGQVRVSPPIRFQVASYYVASGQRLDRVNDLVEGGLKAEQEMNDVRKQRSGDDAELLQMFAKHEHTIRWQAWKILAECSLKVGKVDDVSSILDKMKNDLNETSQKADATTEEAISYRGHQSEFWRVSAMLAEQQKRPVEALAFYHNAAMTASNSDDDEATEDDVRSKAHSIWKQLGGTDDGWATWNLLADFGGPGSAGKGGRWKDAELRLPDTTLVDLTGKPWKISDLRGKTLFVNIWATWCGPCRTELPQLQQLYNELKDRKDLAIITLNVDENVGAIQPYVSKQGFTFPVIMAADYVYSLIKQLSIPRNWIVDGSGVVISELIGFDQESRTWKEDLMAQIEKAVDAAPRSTAEKTTE